MTLLLLDVASYQGALATADVVRAGFGAVNLKISHGLTQKSVHPDLAGWVSRARAAGLGISTFHWLDGSASGKQQAAYAHARLAALGLTDGAAHAVDCEDNASEVVLREYVIDMQARLGRRIAIYSADWWWLGAGRKWAASDLTPYVWGAPNAGYLGSYPGDASAHWTAGWGGWPSFAVLQYAVQPLSFPDGKQGSIDVSKSAVRDPAVWADLTTGKVTMTVAPTAILNGRAVIRRETDLPWVSLGIIGDDDHNRNGDSYHLGKSSLKSSSYTLAESSRDRNGATEDASALDVGWFSIVRNGKTFTLRHFSLWLVEQCEAGAADTLDIREIIYSPDGKTVKRWDRLKVRSTGDDSHLTHTHISWFRDASKRDNKAALFERYFAEIKGEDDVSQADVIAALQSPAGKKALALAIMQWDPGNDPTTGKNMPGAIPNPDPNPANVAANPTISPAHAYYCAIKVRYEVAAVATQVAALTKAVASILSNVQADDGDQAALLAALTESNQATADLVLTSLADAGRSDEDVAAALRAALGGRASNIGALLSAE